MNSRTIIFTNAAKIFLSITGFFFLIKLIGLSHVIELRFLNIVFVLWGINSAIKTNIQKIDTSYIGNLFVGLSTAYIASLATITAMVIYVTFLDNSLIQMLHDSSFWGNQLTLPQIIFSMVIEATAGCIISTFILMQYWKSYAVKATT